MRPTITDEEIEQAESKLFPQGGRFDNQARAFIRNFNTIDLQAVPGCGKTTALLAKLLILEKRLPLPNNSGILVISHTNAAIEEIETRIKQFCPKLFSYPNFVGTIQRFVDEFLAIPYYASRYKKRPVRIDSEAYYFHTKRIYYDLLSKGKLNWFTRKNDPESLFCDLRFDCERHLVNYKTKSTVLINNGNETYRTVAESKLKLIHSGILSFDEAYLLALLYLLKYPKVKSVLQKRFGLVFVDEMQDMDDNQYNVLESIFFNEERSTSVFQRIGDKNQAIYSKSGGHAEWIDRSEILPLSNSLRLSESTAKVVKNFAIHRQSGFELNGLNQGTLKPHMLIFNNETVTHVIPFFADLLLRYRMSGHLPDINRYPSKVICSGVHKDPSDDKLYVRSYFSKFRSEKVKIPNDYDCLKKYLIYFEKDDKTLYYITKNLTNLFLKILRLEGVQTSDERYFTATKFYEHIKSVDLRGYEELRLKLYQWSMRVIAGDIDATVVDIREYIPNLTRFYNNFSIRQSREFIECGSTSTDLETTQSDGFSNQYSLGDITLEITSIHAVKGQTHCATLYLESFYNRNYESTLLKKQFRGESIVGNTHRDLLPTSKLVFVGFSRPTNLLCYAIHEDRLDDEFREALSNDWEFFQVVSLEPQNPDN